MRRLELLSSDNEKFKTQLNDKSSVLVKNNIFNKNRKNEIFVLWI